MDASSLGLLLGLTQEEPSLPQQEATSLGLLLGLTQLPLAPTGLPTGDAKPLGLLLALTQEVTIHEFTAGITEPRDIAHVSGLVGSIASLSLTEAYDRVLASGLVIPNVPHLLPSNATDYEKAMSVSDGNRIESIDPDIIKTLWNPWTCPSSMIPYLAWAYGTDIWDDKWPEATKRRVIADMVRLKRHKGTPYTIKAYPSYFGSTVVRMVRPPARPYHREAVTPDAWADWLASMPQIRIFPFADFGDGRHRRFHSSVLRTAYYGHGFNEKTRGPQLYGKDAFLFQDGVETPIGLEPVEDGGTTFDRVLITSSGSKRAYHGHGFTRAVKRFHQTTLGDLHTLSIQIDHNSGPLPTLIAPSTTPTTTLPTRVFQVRTAPKRRGFHKRKHWRAWHEVSYAPFLVYDRIALLDRTKAVRRRKVKAFHGRMQFGIDPYTAKLIVEIPMVRPQSRFNKFHVGFVKKADMSPLTKTIDALKTAKSFRDTLLIDTIVYRSVRLKDNLPLGSYKLGETLKVA